MTFGEKIREARKNKKYTQKQLAQKIGAAHNSISDWENDKNKPDPDTIELLCGVLEITPNYLLASSSDEFSPFEKLLIKKYRDLDDHGREMVDFTLEKEWERSTAPVNNIVPLDHLIAQAAQKRDDIDVTDEMVQADNETMMSDDF